MSGSSASLADGSADSPHRTPDRVLNASEQKTHWRYSCAYCGASRGGADPCCADCRQDIHAHCPSWPSCLRPDYGRPCDARLSNEP